MTMARWLGLSALGLGGLLACEGTVSLGIVPEIDAGSGIEAGSDATPESDGSPTVDASIPDSGISIGLFVDDIACTDLQASSEGQWPNYEIAIVARCATIGKVRALIASNAELQLPQTCGLATRVSLAVNNHEDGGGSILPDFFADSTRGSCTLTSGPTPDDPNRGVSYTSVVEHLTTSGAQHRVSYRAANAY